MVPRATFGRLSCKRNSAPNVHCKRDTCLTSDEDVDVLKTLEDGEGYLGQLEVPELLIEVVTLDQM
jgi:hypothetical protein